MINDAIKNLKQKISELEHKILKFEKTSENIIDNYGFSTWTNNLLNINILSRKTIHIKSIKNENYNNLFYQLKIKLFNHSPQTLKFDLFCDNIQIGTEQQEYQNGIFEATIVGSYQNSISNTINVSASIKPKSEKQVTILATTLTVWGITQNLSEEFDAVIANSNCVLSYISNNRLYYKIFNKDNDDKDFDFNYLNNALSHSLCGDDNKIIQFRVDTDGNLFYSSFLETQEIFIANNVTKVSSCFFNNSILFSYISNGDCFYGEIINNIVISNTKLTSLLGKFNNCYMYSNHSCNKCYLILGKENGNNYLLENISNNFCSSENIFADISLSITTQEGEQ